MCLNCLYFLFLIASVYSWRYQTKTWASGDLLYSLDYSADGTKLVTGGFGIMDV